MTSPRDERFESLLRAHATQSLTAPERAQLQQMAARDRACAGEFAAIDRVHAEFARERALFAAVSAPVEARDEVDEGFTRLAAAGARAEADLRSRLLHSPAPLHRLAHPRLRAVRVGLCVAAAVAAGVLLAAWLGAFDGPPALNTSAPGREVAGGVVPSIMIAPHLSAADRTVSWSPLWHATAYEAVIVDAHGQAVVQRPADQARSTRWELTVEEFAQLRARPELRLRVRALDGVGLPVGTSGDLPLTIR